MAALGPNAHCPACAGSRRRVADGDGEPRPGVPAAVAAADPGDVVSCWECSDGIRADLPYQQFKFDVVAALPPEWVLTRNDIMGWLAARAR